MAAFQYILQMWELVLLCNVKSVSSEAQAQVEALLV